jgi:hypothetical protein
MKYYIDCEFDGHNGPLLSIAMVGENGLSCHFRTTEEAINPWVLENVMPHMEKHDADVAETMPLNSIGPTLLRFIGLSTRRGDNEHAIIADSVVDIGRFCRAISTGDDGEWASVGFLLLHFEVHNVDAWATFAAPHGAVRHNAYWDAMALEHCLENAQ